MFFAPVVRTRAHSPAFRSFDRSFERFVNDAFFSDAHQRLQGGTGREGLDRDARPARRRQDELSITIEGSHRSHRDHEAEAKRQFKAAYELPEEIDADGQHRQARERRADPDPGQEGAGQQRAPDRDPVRPQSMARMDAGSRSGMTAKRCHCGLDPQSMAPHGCPVSSVKLQLRQRPARLDVERVNRAAPLACPIAAASRPPWRSWRRCRCTGEARDSAPARRACAQAAFELAAQLTCSPPRRRQRPGAAAPSAPAPSSISSPALRRWPPGSMRPGRLCVFRVPRPAFSPA